MKYQDKNAVIVAAQVAGSSAKTFKGAAKYLVAHSHNNLPIEKRGVTSWEREYRHALTARYLKRAERIASALGLWGYDDALALSLSLTSKISRPAEIHLENNWPYKKSESRWAGGNHKVVVRIDKVAEISAGSERVWSDNGKWSGNNSYAILTVTAETIAIFPNLVTPDGLVLIHAEKIANREYKITWLEQSRGFELKPVCGWLIRGVHVHASTVEQARKKAFAARKKATAAHMAARIEKRSLETVWVGLDDSFNAGNCKPSTMNFYESLKTRFGAEVGGLRADELVKIRDDIYTRRAVSAAISRRQA